METELDKATEHLKLANIAHDDPLDPPRLDVQIAHAYAALSIARSLERLLSLAEAEL